ncbi:MAG: lysozyme inhibitor LprI family protein [Cellvibrio sp.]|uniref:lysozyme inhibitor LprI family protein n=1 Tax=Cellvibrio sp. TaxID=1965322 RepID=UPI0027222FF3|nr:lysozyme inhibitor LprI family protein [Cellvibrio sp.]
MKVFQPLILTLVMSSFVYADSNSQTLIISLEKCGDYDAYENIFICASGVHEQGDKLLNKQYKSLLNYLEERNKIQYRDTLRKAQRLWIEFRDADCDFSAPKPKEPDDLYRSNRTFCIAKKTLIRLKELEDYNLRRGYDGFPW